MKSGYITIVGVPNSGKSTLLNNILGEELSIVTHKAQTTRQNILGIHNIPGAQMVFLDTPGYHSSEKLLNRQMIKQVATAVDDADVVCVIVDAANPELTVLHEIIEKAVSKKIVIVVNKLDKILDEPWEIVLDGYKKEFPANTIAGISAKTGFGVEKLVLELAKLLPDGEPFYPDDIYTQHPVRFLASEIIREQIFMNLHEEIPYSTAVVIDDYKETPRLHRIDAAIIVEKDSQKGMVIGKGGEMLKRIGQQARVKIEQMVGCKVFLSLFVRVEKNWTKDPAKIKDLA